MKSRFMKNKAGIFARLAELISQITLNIYLNVLNHTMERLVIKL